MICYFLNMWNLVNNIIPQISHWLIEFWVCCFLRTLWSPLSMILLVDTRFHIYFFRKSCQSNWNLTHLGPFQSNKYTFLNPFKRHNSLYITFCKISKSSTSGWRKMQLPCAYAHFKICSLERWAVSNIHKKNTQNFKNVILKRSPLILAAVAI